MNCPKCQADIDTNKMMIDCQIKFGGQSTIVVNWWCNECEYAGTTVVSGYGYTVDDKGMEVK